MNNEILFKYKPISSVDQLARIIDSINNNQIFFPDYKKLNDPLESSGYVIELSGYMGKGLILAADEEDKLVSNKRHEYKILSLTENCFSPSMWAHYTNDYHGICIGYWKNKAFSSARKITYIEKAKAAISTGEMGFIDDSKIEEEVYESFFYKHSDWSYEKEWRIISKQEDDFFHYEPNDLACIIMGEKLSNEIRNMIIKSIDIQVPIYHCKVGYRSFGINLLPISYNIVLDGSIPPFIRTQEELIQDIKLN